MILQLNAELKDSSFLFRFGQKKIYIRSPDTKNSEKKFFNHFHNLHFHDLVHRQDLSCSLYAQPLKQAQVNCQRHTLKDNLS